MTTEEKQELARKVWIASSILLIALVTGVFPGHWFLLLCFIGVAWPVEKRLAELFSKGIRYVKNKLFSFFSFVYRGIEPTWLGRFLETTFPIPVVPVVNNEAGLGSVSESERMDAESEEEENTEVNSTANTIVSAELESSRQDSSSELYFSSTSKIASELGQSVSSEVTSESNPEYDGGTEIYGDSYGNEEEEDFVECEAADPANSQVVRNETFSMG